MFDPWFVHEWSGNAGRLAIGGGPLPWIILGWMILKDSRLSRLAVKGDGFAMRADLIPREEVGSPGERPEAGQSPGVRL